MEVAEESAGRGRPTLYRAEYCNDLIDHMKKGLSFEAFAGRIGVCKDTLYEWLKVHSEFSDARKRALEMSRLYWEQLGMAGTLGLREKKDGTVEKFTTFNPTMWIFQMKNRFRDEWRDRQEVEQKTTVLISTPQELLKLAEAAEQKKSLDETTTIKIEPSEDV